MVAASSNQQHIQCYRGSSFLQPDENNGFFFDRRRRRRRGRLNWKYAIRQCVKSSSFPLGGLFLRSAACCFIRRNPTIFRELHRSLLSRLAPPAPAFSNIQRAAVFACRTQPIYAFKVPIYALLMRVKRSQAIFECAREIDRVILPL